MRRRIKSRFRGILDNPAKGMEYNNINGNRRVSRRKYSTDIASNPRLVKGGLDHRFLFVDVQAEADKVNSNGGLINVHRYLVEGRT
jgi:hypothetical protein